jgi:FAD dependent oxidoreductase
MHQRRSEKLLHAGVLDLAVCRPTYLVTMSGSDCAREERDVMQGSGTTMSVWMEASGWLESHKADIGSHVEVVVIGAGIAGLTTAHLLQREGRQVLVLDDGPVGSGETSRTTAHLSNAIDDRFSEMERIHGMDGSRLAAESHGAAIDRIEAIIRDEGIDCDFKRIDGYLILAEGCPVDLIDNELAAAHRAGLREVVRVERAPVPQCR